MFCKICEEGIFFENGRWQHRSNYSHIIEHEALPEENTDPFMHKEMYKNMLRIILR